MFHLEPSGIKLGHSKQLKPKMAQRTTILQRSQRAKRNKLMVVSGECPKCHHKKLLESMNLEKCAKCKYVIKRWL